MNFKRNFKTWISYGNLELYLNLKLAILCNLAAEHNLTLFSLRPISHIPVFIFTCNLITYFLPVLSNLDNDLTYITL